MLPCIPYCNSGHSPSPGLIQPAEILVPVWSQKKGQQSHWASTVQLPLWEKIVKPLLNWNTAIFQPFHWLPALRNDRSKYKLVLHVMKKANREKNPETLRCAIICYLQNAINFRSPAHRILLLRSVPAVN